MAMSHRVCFGASVKIHYAHDVPGTHVVRRVQSVQHDRFETILAAYSHASVFHHTPLSKRSRDDVLRRRSDALSLKRKTLGRECFCASLHALSPSLLLPNVVVVVFDPYTLPVDVPFVVAGHVLNPQEPWNRVTCRFSGVAV